MFALNGGSRIDIMERLPDDWRSDAPNFELW